MVVVTLQTILTRLVAAVAGDAGFAGDRGEPHGLTDDGGTGGVGGNGRFHPVALLAVVSERVDMRFVGKTGQGTDIQAIAVHRFFTMFQEFSVTFFTYTRGILVRQHRA